jgi:eukaryotic-like serine/threonine-protein kinase
MLAKADTAELEAGITSLRPFRRWAEPRLQWLCDNEDDNSNAKLHAALALIDQQESPEQEVLDFLRDRLLTVTPAQFGTVSDLLRPHRAALVPLYSQWATDEQQPAARRFHAACALARFAPEHGAWDSEQLTQFVANQVVVSVNPIHLELYQGFLRGVAPKLLLPLSEIFEDRSGQSWRGRWP